MAGETPALRWGVCFADDSAFQRARAVLRSRGTLTGVCGGPEEARVPARRMDTVEEVLAASDAVIVGGPDAERTARTALEAGCHVSAALPLTFRSKTMLRLAHIAKAQRRLLHLFEPELHRPAFRTLRGHCRAEEVEELVLAATYSRTVPASPRDSRTVPASPRDSRTVPASPPDSGPVVSPADLVHPHLAELQQLVVLGGPVAEVTRAQLTPSASGTRFDATLVFRKGARASIELVPGERDARVIDVRSGLSWRIEGAHLYCGNSMTTLTDNRSPSELAVLELEMVAGGRGRPALTLEAHYHTLVVIEALVEGRTGRLR
ncbi:MAG: hypothetical protein R3F61_37305 [Myxococcota bacterium]